MRSLSALTAFFLVLGSLARAQSIYDIPVKDIDGKPTSLAPFKGRVILVVNTASECGFTPQYEQLESGYEKYKDRGLTVVGFPCNQFGEQEPGTSAIIKKFCTDTYHVTFPLFEKIEVNGDNRHPLYVQLAGKDSPFPGDIKWNFTKFLVGRDGKILARFDSAVKPDDPAVIKAIESALGDKAADQPAAKRAAPAPAKA